MEVEKLIRVVCGRIWFIGNCDTEEAAHRLPAIAKVHFEKLTSGSKTPHMLIVLMMASLDRLGSPFVAEKNVAYLAEKLVRWSC